MQPDYDLRIFTGNANPALAASIAAELDTPLGEKIGIDGEAILLLLEALDLVHGRGSSRG